MDRLLLPSEAFAVTAFNIRLAEGVSRTLTPSAYDIRGIIGRTITTRRS